LRTYLGFTVLCLLCFGQGCVAERKATFDEKQLTPYAGKGTGTVTGQAFLKTVGGDVKYGAGNKVLLVPAIDWTREAYERGIVHGETLSPAPPAVTHKLEEYSHTTVADGSGNFEFHELPPGSYFVACKIVWQVGGGIYASQTGGVAHGEVEVKAGETAKVIVTSNN
jgi:hypothetical protein